MSKISPMTPAGIEPATFRFVAQHTVLSYRTKYQRLMCISLEGHENSKTLNSYRHRWSNI